MGMHEHYLLSKHDPEPLHETYYYYGKLYSDLKVRMLDAQREGKIDFRNPGGKEMAESIGFNKGAIQRIAIRQFHISPPHASLNIQDLNSIAHEIALEADHLEPGFYFKSGLLLQKDGIVFPQIVVEETLAQIEKRMSVQVVNDPYGRGEEFASQELTYAVNRDTITQVHLVQRTKIIVYPSKHIAQLQALHNTPTLLITTQEDQNPRAGLKPDAMMRFRIAMDKKDIDNLPPGQTDWLDDVLR